MASWVLRIPSSLELCCHDFLCVFTVSNCHHFGGPFVCQCHSVMPPGRNARDSTEEVPFGASVLALLWQLRFLTLVWFLGLSNAIQHSNMLWHCWFRANYVLGHGWSIERLTRIYNTSTDWWHLHLIRILWPLCLYLAYRCILGFLSVKKCEEVLKKALFLSRSFLVAASWSDGNCHGSELNGLTSSVLPRIQSVMFRSFLYPSSCVPPRAG